MARNIFANITERGTKAQFAEAMATIPTIWDKFAQTIPSDAPDETHVWMGMLPQPREYVSGRSFQGFRDFTYNIANKEYELSYLIDQNSIEDDKHGLINQRTRDAAKLWASFKDVQFAALMNNGATAGYVSYDGVTFWNGAHVIGSESHDNTLTRAVTEGAITQAEIKGVIQDGILFLQGAKDDQGQGGYHWPAMSKVLLMGSEEYAQPMIEAVNSSLTGGGDSNPYYQHIGEPIVNPFLGTTNKWFYVAAVGDVDRMPVIYQERTKFDIQVLNSAEQVALNHGVIVLARQRYRMWYGEPRRMCQNVLT